MAFARIQHVDAWCGRIGGDRAAAHALWACDGAAVLEVQRMVTEKIQAAFALPSHAVRGDFGHDLLSAAQFSLDHYGKAIRANRRRLSAPSGRRQARKR